MKNYQILKNKKYSLGEYRLVPIRDEDKFLIMKWRNDQIDFLRQDKKLTNQNQINYFKKTISKLFDQQYPDQLLFSFLKKNICVGYGGLVHINWKDKNAEISFIMDTKQENIFFNLYWKTFLTLIDQVAFKELNFHKIQTYAFDLRPKLYVVLEQCGYKKEKVLVKSYNYNDNLINIVIHSKIKK